VCIKFFDFPCNVLIFSLAFYLQKFSVCMSVCFSARISQKPYFQTSPHFLCMLPVALLVPPLMTLQHVMYMVAQKSKLLILSEYVNKTEKIDGM